MSTQVDLFTNVEPTSISPAIAKLPVSRSTFYQGDCLVEMDKIADKSVDMILCDLPYGTTACKWDSIIPFEPLWKHYERVIKDNGAIVLTASQPFTSVLINSKIALFKYEWIWNKRRAANFMSAKFQPMKFHENICVFSKGGANNGSKIPMKYNPQMREFSEASKERYKYGFKNGVISDNFIGRISKSFLEEKEWVNKQEGNYPISLLEYKLPDKKIHSTQKPVELMEYLIKTYTNEGDTVLDNCMGSGSTGVACKKTGRNFIGIEKDEKYFEIAVSRVSAYCG